MIRVVVKQPGEEAQIRLIDGNLPSMQEIVGGYLEAHRIADMIVYCNDGSEFKYMAPNVYDDCHGVVLVGTVFLTRNDAGLRSMDDARRAKHLLDEHSVMSHDRPAAGSS